uniref:Uncharacterized protein n=1 Tax=Arundo donax TaxID=35708 RepID=A0A0A8ZLN1_ARUDO
MFHLRFLLSLQFSVDFAHALNALLLVHLLGLLLGRRGSRLGSHSMHFNNIFFRIIHNSCLCVQLVPGCVVCFFL